MKIKLSLLLISLLNLAAFSQIYDELKNQEVDFGSATEENIQFFVSNIYSFVGDDFDSLDIQLMLTRELIGGIMIEKTPSELGLTYGDIYNRLLKAKQNPEFSEYKENAIIINELLKRPADYKNWEEDQKLLSKLEDDRHTLLTIGSIIKEKNDPSLTYQDILEEFYEEKNAREEKEPKEEPHEIVKLFDNIELFNEEKLLHQSKQENKPILLYFTGHNAINSRKLEVLVLFEKEVADKIMDNFILVPLYVDENIDLPKKLQKEVKYGTKTKIQKTIGDRNSFYQYSRFETSAQPYFVVLNSENEIIETADYNYNTTEKFLSFLNSALDKAEKQ